MIRFLTAGESHGPCLLGILEGMPAGLAVSEQEIARDLRRRQLGYGRGQRMKIESDHARILSGVRYGLTLGSPIALQIENKDWPNWISQLRADAVPPEERAAPVTAPRPGHADFAGAVKYRHADLRNVIERSSARETAMRVALGAVCRKFLGEFGVGVASHVLSIGSVVSDADASGLSCEEINHRADENPVRCLDDESSRQMMAAVDRAQEHGDTLGGMFEVVASGLPVGLGSHVHWDRRLDALLSAVLLSIPGVKSVTFGRNADDFRRMGSEVHDRMYPAEGGVMRRTNRAGGIEGGMSNGELLVVRAAMKPLSTLGQPLETVDLSTGRAALALRERSDICAVPAAAVIGEAMCLLALINPFLEKFGGDSVDEVMNHVKETPGFPWD
jgi:chorismate synthase